MMTLRFYPDLPKIPSRIVIPLIKMQVEFVREPGGILWHYGVKTDPGSFLINSGCYDVTKSKVHRVFDMVFPYRISATYLSLPGQTVVQKGEGHSKSGVMKRTPVERQPGMVYEKLIDSRISTTEVVDYRVFFFKGVDFIIEKIRPIPAMFGSGAEHSVYREPPEVFSPHEIELITKFCQVFGMDFGELDVLRHSNGEIYIVDVNNVPGDSGLISRHPRAEMRYAEQVRQVCDIIKR